MRNSTVQRRQKRKMVFEQCVLKPLNKMKTKVTHAMRLGDIDREDQPQNNPALKSTFTLRSIVHTRPL